ncbi:MAG: hypothetical protein JST82_03160 [Bacteroidetes bacterium]|nr:hypothetical protein [Bacteroidota bacterium]
MTKTIITIVTFLLVTLNVFATENSTATQTVQLNLAPAIELYSIAAIAPASNNNTQTFAVNSNKAFKISVSTITETQNLTLSVTENNTNGKAANHLKVSSASQDLIANATRGNEKTFSVNAKTKTNTTVVYTATQA